MRGMLEFDNRFVRELPGDPESGPRLRQVEGALWSPVMPTPVAAPRLVAHSREMAARLGIAVDGVFGLLRAIVMLPARVLGGR